VPIVAITTSKLDEDRRALREVETALADAAVE
jgi:hypothetical protein